MKYKNKSLLIYNSKLYLIIKLVSFLFIINKISTRIISRLDIDQNFIIENILYKIHTNFLKYNNIYKESLSEYNISMKFLNIKLSYEKLIQDNAVGQQFFSFIEPNIEFILNINITNNNDMKNNPDNKVSILFNSKINDPVLNFNLENIYAKIKSQYIEFKRNTDYTYYYKFFYNEEQFSKLIDIFLNLENIKYIPKIYNILKKNEEKIKLFLFNSFCSYLDEIINKYPEPYGQYLYEKIVENAITIKTFSLVNKTHNLNLEKINFNKIDEEQIIKVSNGIQIINIKINFNLIFTEGKSVNYHETIPELTIYNKLLFLSDNDTFIANTTLNTIIYHTFNLILEKY